MDGILYVLRTGCAWRYLPADFPPWQTVYWYFRRWEQAKVTEVMLAALREQAGVQVGRNPRPSAGIIDSQTVKGADTVGRDSRGYDAGKKINGRKRFIVADTLGLLIVVVVLAAGVQDRDGAKITLLSASLTSPIRFVFADGGFVGSSSTGPVSSSPPWCTSCANPKASTASPSFHAAGASNAPWPGLPPTAASPATTNATPPPPKP